MSEPTIDFPRIWKEAGKRFQVEQSSIHGPDHWSRVEAHGLTLVEQTPGADLIVVRLFAVLHDSQRMNDWGDPEHGPRAAEFAQKMQGLWYEVSGKQLDQLVEACRFHTDGTTTQDPTIGCCWDADRLDLPRVCIEPHPDFMSTDFGKKLAEKFL